MKSGKDNVGLLEVNKSRVESSGSVSEKYRMTQEETLFLKLLRTGVN